MDFKLENIVILIEIKHQGSVAEKSAVQKPNQGVRKNVLNIIFP